MPWDNNSGNNQNPWGSGGGSGKGPGRGNGGADPAAMSPTLKK